MDTADSPQAQARKQARIALAKYQNPDHEQIRRCCDKAKRWTEEDAGEGSVDVEELVEYFLTTANIFVAPLSAISDARGHIDWLNGRRGEIAWKFWERYQTFLENIEELPTPVVKSIDLRTESVLELLENPKRQGRWDRRGLVVGSVQSGKTGNFLGLACKALDAGYKLVVILAGIHNSLRAQTQIRMEEGLLGYNTDSSLFFENAAEKVGVGTLIFEDLHVNSMTSRSENGDFSSTKLGATVRLGETPFIVVVKKHARILENLQKWIAGRDGVDVGGGRKVVRDIAMLVIDDEADHSSINTNKSKRKLPDGVTWEDVDPTKINARIRELLGTFEKSAYVGYTATPFANIFVDPNSRRDNLGDDLFPRSFIISLPPPDNYISVEKVFGRLGDPDAGIEGRAGLPLTRVVVDFGTVFPERAGPDFVPDRLPNSLREAIFAFILACTARHARGQTTKHNSMLIHVARYVGAQRQLADLVRTDLLFLQRRIAQEGPDAAKAVRQELRELWERDFSVTTAAVAEPGCPAMSWEEIEPSLLPAASKVKVLEINGTSADILEYDRNKKTGISVIAIGGDKLSRGLTLEGLTVSYYMRVSKMYDSLLQMGRWFGYRPKYLDLCRIYTSDELISWYRHIALAEAELRREFERMAALKATPEEYGLRVRTHPDGMLVTALNKARASTMMQVSFEGTLAQCVVLDTREGVRRKNDEALSTLLLGCGTPRERAVGVSTRVWSGVASDLVCAFLDEFTAPMGTNGFDARRVAQFIRRQQGQHELTDWTVALVSVGVGERVKVAGAFDVGLVTRNPVEEAGGDGKRYVLQNSNVLNPPDQAIDLEGVVLDEAWVTHLLGKRVFRDGDSEERAIVAASVGRDAREVAIDLSVRRFEVARSQGRTRPNQTAPTQPVGRAIRDVRRTSHGLLLLYPLDGKGAKFLSEPGAITTCALSFPTSSTAMPIEYQVNEVYKQLNLDRIEEPDADA